MLHKFKRHPFAVTAFFRHCLVLTYAFPREVLQPLLPPGLVLDTYGEFGFLAIALVHTEHLRPSFLPEAFGRNFFLSGYRIFTRLGSSASSLRGLRILRSDTDRAWMVRAGNLLTHYRYELCQLEFTERPGTLEWTVRTPNARADLNVLARISSQPAPLPAGSPFANANDARRFAGPLPFTFDYERETHSIIRVRGVRPCWKPQPAAVEIRQNTFLRQAPFCNAAPMLANAFYLRDAPYRWERGTRVPAEAA
jgi:hypothetical protein